MPLFATHIIENDDGEPVIAIDALSGAPEMPSLVLNNGNKAVFYRSAEQCLDVSNMNAEMRGRLLSAQKVLIAEVGKDGHASGYYASVKELN